MSTSSNLCQVFPQPRRAVLAAVYALVLAACSQPVTGGSSASSSSGSTSSSASGCVDNAQCELDVGVGSQCVQGTCTASTNIQCEEDEECASLGAGHMCMGGGCMLMVVDAPVVMQPAASEQVLDVAPLTDVNPDPAVFEGTLVAAMEDVELASGKMTPAFVFKDGPNGAARIPGPLIDVKAGDLLRIHFENHLDQPATIHWHGIRLPVAMDGVPDVSQPAVPPGGSFTYEFHVPDAALFWYHPHVRSDEQQERGLYGMLRVASPTPVPVDAERLLAVDDILLDANGNIEPPDHGSAVTGDKMKFSAMMGRQGNLLLVNGRANPFIHVRKGTVERWRIVNTANARFFRLRLAGHSFVLIGVDGGLLAAPRRVDELFLAPSERVDVLVQMDGNAGDTPTLITHHYNRGHDIADPGDLVVATLMYDQDAPGVTPLPATSTTLQRWPESATPEHTITMGETLLRGSRVGFTLNNQLFPNVPMEEAVLGRVETWLIKNETHMDHPFHLHGFQFQVLSHQPLLGVREDEVDLGLKDTVVVRAREEVRLVVKYDGFPGEWMFHCHILEHAENGMMGMVQVTSP